MGRSVYKFRFIRLSRIFFRSQRLKKFIYPVFGLIFILLFIPLIRRPDNKNEPLYVGEVQEKIETVAALGQITPIGETRFLAAPLLRTGGMPRVAKLLVEEGDTVNKGQVLAIFDNRISIQADLNISKARLKTVQTNILFQSRQVNRYQKAALQGAATLSALDTEKDLLNKLKGKEKELISEIIGLEIDYNNTSLTSPIDGIVLKVNYREGERPGLDGVLQVGRNNFMEALIEVYESDINRVRIGQVVSLISENGGFDGNLKGIVTRISPQIQQRKVLSTDPTGDADARIVEVRVTLEPKSSAKVVNFTGMKVIARFEQ